MARDKDPFLKQLERRQAGTTPRDTSAPDSEATQPPTELPTDPTERAEWLQDELTSTRERLEKEKDARQQAERRLEAQTRPSSLAEVLRQKQSRKRRTWR